MKLRGELKRRNCMKAKGTCKTESTQIRWFSRQSGGDTGLCERWSMATQRGPSGLSPLSSDGPLDGQAERVDQVTKGQDTQNSAKLKGNYHYQAPVHSDQMVLTVGLIR
jgi:hypothetical protein